MGILGKLFEKKICSVCGSEIKLLSNRKLEDGNLCKECAGKLSPRLSDRRSMTVAQINEHLRYREENAGELAALHPDRVLGKRTKIYLDTVQRKFIVTGHSDWRSSGQDVIGLDQVMDCTWDVKEHKRELFQKDEQGKQISYQPPRYEYSYEFDIVMHVDSPWFSQIEFELTDERPESRLKNAYREWQREAEEICAVMTGKESGQASDEPLKTPAVPQLAPGEWLCVCGTVNQGKFCPNCGAARPAQGMRCPACGWTSPEGGSVRFCPNCGMKIGQ